MRTIIVGDIHGECDKFELLLIKVEFSKTGDDIRRYKEWFNRNTVKYFEDEHFQCTHAAVKTSPICTNDEYTLMMNHFETKKNRYSGKLTITGHIHLSEPTYFNGCGGKGFSLDYGMEQKLPQNGIICIDTNCGKIVSMIIYDKTYRLEYVY